MNERPVLDIVNDITNFCFRLLQKPYTVAPARPKTKFLMSLTIAKSLNAVHAVRAQKEKGNQKKGKGKSYVGL